MGSYRILPLRKVDGVAFLIRGLYKKPIDLAAVQNQSLELWPESLKAGDLRFLYRSLMVSIQQRILVCCSGGPRQAAALLMGPFHPNYCGVGSYRNIPLSKIDGVAFLIRGLYKKPRDLGAVQNQSLELWPESLKAGDLRFLYRSLSSSRASLCSRSAYLPTP